MRTQAYTRIFACDLLTIYFKHFVGSGNFVLCHVNAMFVLLRCAAQAIKQTGKVTRRFLYILGATPLSNPMSKNQMKQF